MSKQPLAKSSSPAPRSAVHPLEFLLWGFLVSVFMLFAGLTSAYMVRRADGNWLDFQLPEAFALSTVLVVVSTLSLEFARKSARRNEFPALRAYLGGPDCLAWPFWLPNSTPTGSAPIREFSWSGILPVRSCMSCPGCMPCTSQPQFWRWG